MPSLIGTIITCRATKWLMYALIAIMTVASFLAFVAMSIAQGFAKGHPWYGFGSFAGADPLILVLWWVAFTMTALGVLSILSSTADEM